MNGSNNHHHPPIRLIASDLDGTLLNSHHQLSERTLAAVGAAMAQGVRFVIATGKTRTSALDVIPQLGLNAPGVFVQGLVIHNADGSIRSSEALDPELVREIAGYCEANSIPLTAYSDLRLLCRQHHPTMDTLTRHGEPPAEEIGSLSAAADRVRMNKLVVFGDPAHITEARVALTELVGGRVTLVQAMVDGLEVLPLGASKGRGLMRLLADLGIDPANVLAIGDGENDAEMLRLAGIGVAVANAMPHAKEAADYIVGSNDEDGVADAIERFVLNGRR